MWLTMLKHKERHTISHGCSESCQSWGRWVCRDSSASSTSSWRTLCLLRPLSRICLWPAYLSEHLHLIWATIVLIHVTCQHYEKPWPSLKYNFHPLRGWIFGQSSNFLDKNFAGSLYDLPASYHDTLCASSWRLCIARSASSLCEGVFMEWSDHHVWWWMPFKEISWLLVFSHFPCHLNPPVLFN
jgi:hypothetical protein